LARLLGEGGFASVFRTRDNVLNRDVACEGAGRGARAIARVVAERFLREAQTVATLEHPHIVPIYKVGRQEEIFYIIMRCIDGPSLRQLLETQKKLSVGDAARIARQVPTHSPTRTATTSSTATSSRTTSCSTRAATSW